MTRAPKEGLTREGPLLDPPQGTTLSCGIDSLSFHYEVVKFSASLVHGEPRTVGAKISCLCVYISGEAATHRALHRGRTRSAAAGGGFKFLFLFSINWAFNVKQIGSFGNLKTS